MVDDVQVLKDKLEKLKEQKIKRDTLRELQREICDLETELNPVKKFLKNISKKVIK